MDSFWRKIQLYGKLSDNALNALQKISRERSIQKHEHFLNEGSFPKTVAFVTSGLFAQFYISEKAEVVIKKFFPEQHFMASLSVLITGLPSVFSIKALENSSIVEFSFQEFKRLTQLFPEMAAMYINYLEQHWVVEKEPLEISLRHDNASTRYRDFLKCYPGLDLRLKQHEIAAFLGITPTQLSRIRAELSNF